MWQLRRHSARRSRYGRLWRKHHLGYDQTKNVVEEARRRIGLEPLPARRRTVQRPDRAEIERLIQATYRHKSKYGLMIRTPFHTGPALMSSGTSELRILLEATCRRFRSHAWVRRASN